MLVAVLVCVAVLGAAQVSAECGTLQALRVEQEWAEAYSSGENRHAFITAVWRNFFKRQPDAHGLFARVKGENIYSAEFHAHAARVLGSLDIAMVALSNTAILNAHLSHLHTQHTDRGVSEAFYTAFGDALVEEVGHATKHRVAFEAWHACYDVVAAGIFS